MAVDLTTEDEDEDEFKDEEEGKGIEQDDKIFDGYPNGWFSRYDISV